ncbi:MAG: T9SS type A sorting domain-containing protein [Crocinitomicaceae bacterium]
MKKISIPEPCHENWADFTPTEKGAFCGSCQTDVVDFSNKTPFEVKSILAENAGKHMCGRFRKSQLEELNHEYVEWEGQSTTIFRSKFLYACLVVFGMSLFTGCSIQESSLAQSIFLNNTELNLTSMQVGNDPVDPDSLKIETRHLKGKVAYTPPLVETPTDCSVVPDTSEVEEIFEKGDIAYDPNDFLLGDTIYVPQEEELKGNLIEDTTKHEVIQDTLFDDTMIDGLIRFPIEEIEDTSEVKVTLFDDEMIEGKIKLDRIELETPLIEKVEEVSIEEKIEATTPLESTFPSLSYIPEFKASVFPNPASNLTTVEIEVVQEALFDIYLYAINGKKIKTLFNGIYAVGIQRIVVDLKAYEAGSYLIVINGEKQKETFKLEKID